LLEAIQQAVAAQFTARHTCVTSTVNAGFAWILHPVKTGVARIAFSTAIDPSLTEQGIVLAIFTGVAWRANRTAAIHQFLAVVEDSVVAVFGD
jgi:hypothetical protein